MNKENVEGLLLLYKEGLITVEEVRRIFFLSVGLASNGLEIQE